MKKSVLCISFIFLSIGFFIAKGIAFQAPKWKGKVIEKDNVAIVQNPKAPVYKENDLAIEEELSIGGENAPPETILGLVSDLAVGSDGRIYVADIKLSQIKIFDEKGKFVLVFGRRGQAPGEFALIGSLSLCEVNRELYVDGRNRASIFGLDGTYIRTVPYRMTLAESRADSWGNIYSVVIVSNEKESGYQLQRMDAQGKPIALLARAPINKQLGENPFRPFLRWCLRNDGYLVEGYPESYEIRIHNTKGEIVRRITREYDPVIITSQARNLQNDKSDTSFIKYYPSYNYLTSDENGWVYVQTSERSKDGERYLYDIFDQEGKYLIKVPLPGRLQKIQNGKLFTVEEDKGGFVLIKRYALKWLIKPE